MQTKHKSLYHFCLMKRFHNQFTGGGEIFVDRYKRAVTHGRPEQIDEAVCWVYSAVWADGGAIAQCEFGAGANPANVRQMFKSWKEIQDGKHS
jgi:hypothetical protein